MDRRQKIAGFVELEITSSEPEKLLQALNASAVEIQNVNKISELTYRILIHSKDYIRTVVLCKKRGEAAACVGKFGLYWELQRILKRPILVIGILLIFFSAMLLPNCVLFVRVDGADAIPARRIVEAAQMSGIRFGASRGQVRSEQAKNALLSAMPELQWAGVNTQGCVAVISVREKEIERETAEYEGAVSIVASRDGYILSAEAEAGNILIQPGETVKEGQTLVSAYIDCGSHAKMVRSKGEVFAQTERNLIVFMHAESGERAYQLGICKKISLLIGKKRINLWKDSGILDSRCGRMYEEYYVTLPGGFRLPLAVCIDSYFFYKIQPSKIALDEAIHEMSDFAKFYLGQHMIAGVIGKDSHSVTENTGAFCLRGNYICREMIGRERQEKIGDTNGENS